MSGEAALRDICMCVRTTVGIACVEASEEDNSGGYTLLSEIQLLGQTRDDCDTRKPGRVSEQEMMRPKSPK